MNMSIEKSFDFYLEGTKQLITIASAIITFFVVFSKDFIGIDNILPWIKILVIVSWFFFVVSICIGIWAINAMAGQLDPGSRAKTGHSPSIWAEPVSILVKGQQITFIIGLVIIMSCGGVSVFSA